MKWHIPLIIIAAVLILAGIFGAPGTPSLTYNTETTLTATDPINYTAEYSVTLKVVNTGTAAADNAVVAVYLKTPADAPEWHQTELIFPAGRIAAGEEIILTDTAALTVGEDTYALLANGTSPETTVVGTYSDAFL